MANITRKDRRNTLENFKLCVELWKIIKRFFPKLIPLLKQGKDHRHQSYITYKSYVLLFVRILASVFRIASMRQMSESLNSTVLINNIGKILGMEDGLTELPHWKTINDFLEGLPPTELENIIPELANRLTRMRTFEKSRIRGKYWQILVDATQLFTFEERHCEHCLTREHKDKAWNVVKVDYYHVVLEAKLVINENIVISVATEFVENESPDVKKQDCERNAFHRLAEKLKKRFPRLPICLGADSLYACGPVFDLCREYGWHYIIRFKDGSIPTVAKEFHELKYIEINQAWTKKEGGVTKTYRYVTNIPYQTHSLNFAEYVQSDLKHPFVFLTDLAVSKRNCGQLVLDGRRRWKIENEGFNEQKNHGLGLEHMFSENYTAMKNHYFLIQIGHMIAQFLEAGLRRLTALAKMPTVTFFENLKESFRTETLTETDLSTVNQLTQYRIS